MILSSLNVRPVAELKASRPVRVAAALPLSLNTVRVGGTIVNVTGEESQPEVHPSVQVAETVSPSTEYVKLCKCISNSVAVNAYPVTPLFILLS